MLLHFGRGSKTPAAHAHVDATDDATPSAKSTPSTPAPTPVAKKQQGSPPRSPGSSPKRISPLHVHIPDTDDDTTEFSPSAEPLPPSPSISVRPAELTLEVPPASPTSAPSSAAPSPQVGRNKQSQMRGLSVMSYRIKQLVSKEKRRFDGDGFNLDLTYVTDRLIAFGYPAENLEGIYRNHYKDVYNFFERRHPGRYKIYNLCAERTYDKEKFHNRVAEFPFYDHCPPPLSLFVPFCEDVFAWLNENEQNVVAIHCKAGKGRTGVMICAFLLYTRVWSTAYGALEFFGAARSLKREGVTIPSQQRFIRYFAKMCQDATEEDDDAAHTHAVKELAMKPEDFHQLWEETIDGRGVCAKCRDLPPLRPTLPPTIRLVLTHIRINGVYAHKRIDPRVRIECGTIKTAASYEPIAMFSAPNGVGDGASRPATPASPSASTPSSTTKLGLFWSTVQLELSCDRLLVWDEVKVSLRHRSGAKIGHFWFHTSFVPTEPRELTLLKDEIDKVNKDAKKGHKLYASDFSVTLVFEKATPEDMAGMRAARRAHSAPDGITAPVMSPPATPNRQRPYASMNDPNGNTSSPSGGLDLRNFFGGSSPARARATSDQSVATPFASVVSLVAEAEAAPSRSPSASMISAGGKVSPTGARSVPSSPKPFSMRFFAARRRETSVSVAEESAAPSHADSDDSSSSSTHS